MFLPHQRDQEAARSNRRECEREDREVDRELGSRVPAHGGRVPAHGEARRAQDEAEYLRMEELEHEQKLERERKDEAEYLEYLDGVPGQIYFEVLGGVSVT